MLILDGLFLGIHPKDPIHFYANFGQSQIDSPPICKHVLAFINYMHDSSTFKRIT
jgi:hypothetical protein